MKKKQCNWCREVKELQFFYRENRTKDERRGECKDCTNGYNSLNKEKRYESRRRWERENKDYRREYNQKRKDTESYRFYQYKSNAKRKGHRFEITFDFFVDITSQQCYYCGEFSEDKEFCGIDRKDSTEGYTKTNCVSCCTLCNRMKMETPFERFLEHVQKISHNQNQKLSRS